MTFSFFKPKLMLLIFLSQAIFGSLFSLPSLQDQVAQVMVVHVHGDALTKELKSFFLKVPIGGIILYPWANDLSDSHKTREFCSDIKNYFKDEGLVAPWFFIDEEGGDVYRLQFGETTPSEKDVASTMTPLQAYHMATELADKLHNHCIDVNLAPVVDIPSGEAFPFKTRVFSDNADVTTSYAKCYLEGFRDHHVYGCLKHFPGHGRAKLDTHQGLPVLDVSYDELWKTDWLPYRELTREAPFVMTAHLMVPCLDPIYPATISKKIVTNLLKKRLNYQGFVITDSLIMKGILDINPDVSDIAYQAFLAGHHFLLFGGAWLIEGDPSFELQEQDLITIHAKLTQMFLSSPRAQLMLAKTYKKIVSKKEEPKI